MKIEFVNFKFPAKRQSTRIKLSSTFPIRARCKSCMKGPQFYYIQKLPIKWWDHKHSQRVSQQYYKHIERMCYDFYLIERPKDFEGIMSFTWTHPGKSYNPVFHSKRGVPIMDDMVEFLACECWKTIWAFNQKSTIARGEITHRKARYNYPRKFDDMF